MSTPSSWDNAAPTRRQPLPRQGGQPHELSFVTRLRRAWEASSAQQRLACGASLALVLTMLLPWYSQTDSFVVGNGARPVLKASATSLNAFQAFSFVEAALLLVCASVLAMLFARAEGHSFRLPGGDGAIVMLAGGWAALLVFYRLLDKPGLHGTARITATVGVQWGIFLALGAAAVMAYAGARMRGAGEPVTGEALDAPLLRAPGPPARDEETTATRVTPASTAATVAARRPARSATLGRSLAEGRPPFPPPPTWSETPEARAPRRLRRVSVREGHGR